MIVLLYSYLMSASCVVMRRHVAHKGREYTIVRVEYCLCPMLYIQPCFTTIMPRQSAARQQPINSFSSSADSSTSYLSARPKSHSPRSNFNPFSPLSPHPPDKELEGSDDEDESGAIFSLEDGARRVYTRLQLVNLGEECRKRGFVKPKGMGSLESWYG